MRRAVVAVCALVVLGACGGGGTGARQHDVASPVTGLVVALEGDTMELEVGGRLTGERIAFQIADPYLPPGHLQEHLDLRQPVEVHFERRGDGLVAMMILDA